MVSMMFRDIVFYKSAMEKKDSWLTRSRAAVNGDRRLTLQRQMLSSADWLSLQRQLGSIHRRAFKHCRTWKSWQQSFFGALIWRDRRIYPQQKSFFCENAFCTDAIDESQNTMIFAIDLAETQHARVNFQKFAIAELHGRFKYQPNVKMVVF